MATTTNGNGNLVDEFEEAFQVSILIRVMIIWLELQVCRRLDFKLRSVVSVKGNLNYSGLVNIVLRILF